MIQDDITAEPPTLKQYARPREKLGVESTPYPWSWDPSAPIFSYPRPPHTEHSSWSYKIRYSDLPYLGKKFVGQPHPHQRGGDRVILFSCRKLLNFTK